MGGREGERREMEGEGGKGRGKRKKGRGSTSPHCFLDKSNPAQYAAIAVRYAATISFIIRPLDEFQ